VKSNKKGFTLIEMVIAIGILAVLAVGIMRLFLTSQVSHQKAVDLDYAVLETNALIERFQDIKGSPGNGSSFTIYYNDKWERTNIIESNIQYAIYGDLAKLSDDKAGLLHLDLRVVRLKPYILEKNGENEIYKISVIIEDLSYWGEDK
jgi:prepilin-type N-terminal cleavage/methylation domain-containing protein